MWEYSDRDREVSCGGCVPELDIGVTDYFSHGRFISVLCICARTAVVTVSKHTFACKPVRLHFSFQRPLLGVAPLPCEMHLRRTSC